MIRTEDIREGMTCWYVRNLGRPCVRPRVDWRAEANSGDPMVERMSVDFVHYDERGEALAIDLERHAGNEFYVIKNVAPDDLFLSEEEAKARAKAYRKEFIAFLQDILAKIREDLR